MLRIFWAVFSLLCLSCSCYAQDIICLRTGDTVLGKVHEIGINTVTYERSGGPLYTTNVEEIRNIVFANGKQMYRARDAKGYYLKEGKYRLPVYGNNVISFTPFHPSVVGWQFGLAYERVLKNGILGVYLPVNFGRMTRGKDLTIGSISGEGTFSYYTRQTVTLEPTLKIYPFGNRGSVKYSTGAGLFLAAGERKYVNNTPAFSEQAENVYQLGYFMHHALNLAPEDNVYIGFELMFGYSNYKVPAQDLTLRRILFSTGLIIGYRF